MLTAAEAIAQIREAQWRVREHYGVEVDDVSGYAHLPEPLASLDTALDTALDSLEAEVEKWKAKAIREGDKRARLEAKNERLTREWEREVAIADGLAEHFHSDDPDTLRDLALRVERLTTERDEADAQIDQMRTLADFRLTTALAENERLRAVVEAARDHHLVCSQGDDALDAALAALTSGHATAFP